MSEFQKGMDIVDYLREHNLEEPLRNPMEVRCRCGTFFNMNSSIDHCWKCKMVYGISPHDDQWGGAPKAAGIEY
jgi:hypothetical protein